MKCQGLFQPAPALRFFKKSDLQTSFLQAGLKAIGIDLAVLLRKSGLPLTLWTTGQGMVTTEQHFRLWRTVRDLCEDPVADS